MMKVIKKFRDKHTRKIHEVDSIYENTESDRINELIEKGFIEEDHSKMNSPLLGNVKQVQKRLDGYDTDALKQLLSEEKQGLKRKGVIGYIQKLI